MEELSKNNDGGESQFRFRSYIHDSVLELTGNKRLLIERHYGIVSYSGCCIIVLVSYGKLKISGNCLRFEYMTRDRLLICGMIGTITLCLDGADEKR